MENDAVQEAAARDLNDTNAALITSFCDITSASRQEALFFLDSHQWDLDAAISTFFDNTSAAADDNLPASLPVVRPPPSPTQSRSPDYSPSQSPSRSRSRSPSPARTPYELRSRGKGAKKKGEGSGSRIRTLADLNRVPDGVIGSDDDDDDDDVDGGPQEYYTGGEKSGMLVQDPTKQYDADAIFDQAKNSGVQRPTDYIQHSSSSRSFTGTGRLLSGETVSAAPQPPESVNHTVTLWRNGFTVDDGPLRRFDDPANASFLESIRKSECPLELEPSDRRTQVHLELMRREENYPEPERRRQTPFQGVGRTLGSTSDTDPAISDPTAPSSSLLAAPLPSTGLVVDSSSPTTSIQLRLADGTRMVARFNLHHTIRDIQAFIDASRPGGSRNYQLQAMGFPPKPLTDMDQTVEQAGIANSVVIQKF